MDSKIRRLQIKIETFTKILENIKDLSSSSTTKVGCIALRKDFSKIASFGYNGSYSGAGLNSETGTEEPEVHQEEDLLPDVLSPASFLHQDLL